MTQLIAEADEDGTGGINLQEFCTHMRKRWVKVTLLLTRLPQTGVQAVKKSRAAPKLPNRNAV